MTEKEVRAQTEKVWDEDWGDIDDYGFAFDINELDGYRIGDSVSVIVDEANDPTNPGMINAYEDDEGIVVGFSAPTSGGGPFALPAVGFQLYVAFEDMEPRVVAPSDLELRA